MATYKKKNKDKIAPKGAEEKSSVAELFKNLDSGASRSEQWVLKNQKFISAFLIVGVALALGYWGYTRYIKMPKEQEGVKASSNLERLFEKAVNSAITRERDSLFKLVLEGTEEYLGVLAVIDEYSGTDVANLSYYKAGISFFNLRKYDEAISCLKKFDSKGDALLGSLSLMNIGDSFVQLDKLEEGLEYYKKAVAYNNNTLSVPVALFKAGQVALDLANQIAAGEVVQRPASVVKELLENAIDAKSKTIKLIVKDAGKTLIQVVDDGRGMSITDARMAFERHATSKIKANEDLFNLTTKGFRGEALASIVAVSQIELNTAVADNPIGTLIKIEGSKITSQENSVTPKGTSIAVKNLFYNTPARRNFLKSDGVELKHIIDEFQRVALPHPDINFRMYHNGSEVFNLIKDSFKRRIIQIFGNKTEGKLVSLGEKTSILKLSGFVYKPEFARKHKGEQFFFVNNRFIKSSYFHHAIMGAFEGLLREKTQPGYFVNFEVDPKTIDINIHPTKTEIKFEDEQIIYTVLKSAVKHSLGQYNIAPSLDFSTNKSLEIPYSYNNKVPQIPKLKVNKDYNPFNNKSTRRKESNWDSLYHGLGESSKIEIDSEQEVSSIFEDKDLQQGFTFQIKDKYILTTIKSGLVVINQNRAHQRVLYEQFKKDIQEGTTAQHLIFPITINFGKGDMKILSIARKDLESIGFLFDKFETETLTVTAIPNGLSEKDINYIFESIISDYRGSHGATGFDIKDVLSKNICKSASIKNGVRLNKKEQEQLVNDLFACTDSNFSPFGKKVFAEIKIDEIDNKLN
ncbi:DNA mismatch repair protein MutL [Elysia marginata]|uniref:DNA mismatch repair protein MutL n=1 Tax=Elysia marginata TaxID=1093978 RepID=A0AAV4G7S5_9GAST|nr:DNA mismatch repair protein MutL [Elysia marginata]